MFTYNVQRRFFTKQEDANKYRVSQGLKPNALRVIRIDDREALAALLNALCEPAAAPKALAATFHSEPITKALLDEAFIDPHIPDFLKKDWSVS